VNPFESGARKAIPAVLVYARRSGRVLMIHRDARDQASDYHSGKWNGLGGKCEPDESPRQTAKRELREESGLDLAEESFRPLGVLQFPNFKAHKSEDWLAFVFTVDVPDAAQVLGGPEGSLHWIPDSDVPSLALWKGDALFLPYVLAQRPFIGTIWYEGEEVSRHWIQVLS